MDAKKIAVVGGGPAGMMAAIRSGQLRQDVTLLERNPTLGKKLLLSGKGRCNITNASGLDISLLRFSKKGEFLRDAFKKFFNTDLMDFFEGRGLKLKIERQSRVFPVTDRSDSILRVLEQELHRLKIKVQYEALVKDILVHAKAISGVLLADKTPMPADKVILATGGASYGFTGSRGEGLNLAKKLGHAIVALKPGLVPLEIKEPYPALEGLTLKNVRLIFNNGRQKIISEIGELLFTRLGISGPLVLSLSSRIADWLNENKKVHLEIDLKPALSREQLDARLIREIGLSPKKNIRNVFKTLLPGSLIDIFMKKAGIPGEEKANQINQAGRKRLVSLLKGFALDILRTAPLEEAMVTCGGVSLKDINPRTMESRLIKGLYFAGEMIDIDADTGGFNLQAAFSTGYLAGENAALN